MITRLYLFLLFSFLCLVLEAQFSDGAIAPNFTATDIYVIEHQLFDVLSSGKNVILEFSTTWCGPCWAYHETGALKSFYEEYGEGGSGESEVFFIEVDERTTLDDLNGIGGSTEGDWVTGTNYPIIDDASLGFLYQISGYPRLMMVCQDRRITNLPRPDAEGLAEFTSTCDYDVEQAPIVNIKSDRNHSCESLEVQFFSDCWPHPFLVSWNFGDGISSNETNPKHTYNQPGTYNVTVLARNHFGTTTKIFEDYVKVGQGEELALDIVGQKPNAGRQDNHGGRQALVFDAHNDFVLHSVFVNANQSATREIVLMDSLGTFLKSKKILINEGSRTVPLNFLIPKDNNYMLGLYTPADMDYTNGNFEYPFELDYPFEVEDLVSITGNTSSGFSQKNYYYYFYNWQVSAVGCEIVNSTIETEASLISIFPNPAEGYFNLDIEINVAVDHEVLIFNSLGEEVKRQKVNTKSSRIKIQDMSTGTYMVHLIDLDKEVVAVKKLVVL